MKAIIMHSGLASLSSNTLLKRYIERKLLVFLSNVVDSVLLWWCTSNNSVWTVCETASKEFFYDYTFTFANIAFLSRERNNGAYRASTFNSTGTQRLDVFPFDLPRIHQKLILKLLSPKQRQSQRLAMQLSHWN